MLELDLDNAKYYLANPDFFRNYPFLTDQILKASVLEFFDNENPDKSKTLEILIYSLEAMECNRKNIQKFMIECIEENKDKEEKISVLQKFVIGMSLENESFHDDNRIISYFINLDMK